MVEKITRIAVVGHYTYFENHFPEGWRKDPNILCVDVDESDYGWLLTIYNYRPQLTLFFRPELYPRRYVESIPGLRVAILSTQQKTQFPTGVDRLNRSKTTSTCRS